MLKINNLEYKIDDFHLKINNLKINNNSIHCILGNSGAGKTTLLNLIAGHLNPKRGKILLEEKNINNLKPYKRNIGLIFQDSLLFPNMNVFENIAYSLKVKKLNKEKIKNKVQSWLKKIDLVGFENRMPSELSGGEKKRVTIARTLINEPQFILMDEPFNSLDPDLKKQMLNLITKLKNNTKVGIIYITHSFEDALKISDNISVLENGQIIHSGNPEKLILEPENLSITKFFNYYNNTKINIKDNFFKLYGQKIKLDKSGSFNCIILPQAFTLYKDGTFKILKRIILKYGYIYKIKFKNTFFYAFSTKQFNIRQKIDYKINKNYIIFKQEEKC